MENKACYVPRDKGNGKTRYAMFRVTTRNWKTRHLIFRATRETRKQEETKGDIQKIHCYTVMVTHIVGIMCNLGNSA